MDEAKKINCSSSLKDNYLIRFAEENIVMKLANEHILQILSYVDLNEIATKVSLVSRHFRDLCLDPSLWTTLDLRRGTETRLSAKEAQSLLDRCTLLRKLRIWRQDDSESLAIYSIEQCKRLESLSISCESIRSTFLKAIGTRGHSLRKLSIAYNVVQPGVLNIHGQCLKNITHFDLSYCAGVDDNDLRAIAESCCKLEYLSLLLIPNVRNETMVFFLEKFKTCIKHLLIDGHNMSNATLVRLGDCKILKELRVENASKLRRSGLRAILQLEGLNELTLKGTVMLSGEDLAIAFKEKRFTKLVNLSLHCCVALEFQVSAVFSHCPDIEALSLVSVSDEDVWFIVKSCPNLKYINLRSAPKLTRLGLQKLSCLQHLECLTVTRCGDMDLSSLQQVAKELQLSSSRIYLAKQIRDDLLQMKVTMTVGGIANVIPKSSAVKFF